MDEEEYRQRMKILEWQQQVHEEELKASGQWVDTSGPEYDDEYTMYKSILFGCMPVIGG